MSGCNYGDNNAAKSEEVVTKLTNNEKVVTTDKPTDTGGVCPDCVRDENKRLREAMEIVVAQYDEWGDIERVHITMCKKALALEESQI